MKDLEWLWPYPRNLELEGSFSAPTVLSFTGAHLPGHLEPDFANLRGIQLSEDPSAYSICLDSGATGQGSDEYRLELTPKGGTISAGGSAGLAYGLQTLLQVISLSRGGTWREVVISDRPAYAKRGFMVDMGRSVFPLPMLKRIVRILHRLKMNQLHLHLIDDELCGLRFDGLPFGADNPFALSIEELSELVRYARAYHVEIVPELEAWGHVGSLVHHRTHLRGGEGMYRGSSFLVCEESFDLVREMISQVARAMPQKATIHLGLDEANWFPGPDMPEDFTPTDMVQRYYDILQGVADDQGKELTLRIWADHAGRPVPESIQHNVIIEPWQYWQGRYGSIDDAIARYSGEGKMRWMAGAGVSVGQPRSAYHATRYWCRQARESPNLDGINITFWGTNELEHRIIGLFAGAAYTWNPTPPTDFAQTEDYEDYDRTVFPIMHWWQARFRDAYPDELRADRGPLVHMGHYLWGDRHGEPVTPAAVEAGTFFGHDFLNE